MKTLTINLSDETADRLETLARRLGVSVEDLVRSSVEEQFKSLDDDFEQAAQHVLAKNAELYRRLA
ncbi:ribbon-helix-helix domain-containing protein [Salisaeta longa]|uniref:ribbon-helix-helix domain-containing protein n=1 Tax=Salisaeta longa TaxID=503170 RepID=UPI0003B71BD3|nr:CopG family transcriptional regulator [Salisaeta longa]